MTFYLIEGAYQNNASHPDYAPSLLLDDTRLDLNADLTSASVNRLAIH
jgi:hypothetical protein